MKIAIIFDSRTGNTLQIAEAMKASCAAHEVVAFGDPDLATFHEADIIFAGSWTDKGTCSDKMKRFLQRQEESVIALFGTAGFGGDESYYSKIVSRIEEIIPKTSVTLGYFYCQGKMPLAMRDQYVDLMTKHPEDQTLSVRLENFDQALSHPDEKDDALAKVFVKKIIETYESALRGE